MFKRILILILITTISIAAVSQEESTETDKNAIHEDFLTAVTMGELDLAFDLLSKGADINYLDREGWGALHWAVRAERPESVKFLLEHNPQVDLKTIEENYTALHLVCKTKYRMKKNRLQIAEMLLNAGADPDVKDESSTTPLHMAVTYGFKELVVMLIQRGAQINAETGYHNLTPLHEAASAGNLELVKMLISMSADVNADGRSGWTPLHAAKDAEVAKVLVEAGAKVNAVSSKGLTPLSEAIAKGDRQLSEYLISVGADVTHKLTKTNRTLLHYAGNPDVADLLINSGIDPFQKDTWGYTVLHTAVMWGKKQLVEYFISLGLDINAKITWFIRNDDYPIGSTPLDMAQDADPNGDIVKLLESLHAKTGRYLPGNVYYEDLGNTEIELFRAVRNGQLTQIKNRLNAGANINVIDNAGWTPLHWAAYFGREWTVDYLVKRGAVVNMVSDKRISRKYPEGQTPLDVAEAAGKTEVVKILKNLGGISGKNMPDKKEVGKTLDLLKKSISGEPEE
ncbi:MAG: ankyrin repeat domain-containing protein [Acidobacteria bacterium]|nr:ankyrin repeat domain-containing protein [Acidobacteriota bacterium]